MGFRSDPKNVLTPMKTGFLIPSAAEGGSSAQAECVQEAAREAAKAAGVAVVVSTVATLGAVRFIPWAKKNINYTGQALIISAASIAAFFITADKTLIECGRRNTNYDKTVLILLQ